MDLNKEINLIQGDCLEKMKEIPDKSINLVLIDPPYNINKADWDKWKTVNAYVEFMGQVFLECQRVLKDNGSFYFFHNDFLQIVELQNFINKNTNFIFKQLLIWNKRYNGSPRKYYFDNVIAGNMNRNHRQLTEYCLYYTFQDETGLEEVLNRENFSKISEKIKNYVEDNFSREYVVDLFLKEGRYSNVQSAKVHASYKMGWNKGRRFDLMDEKLYDFLNCYLNFPFTYRELKKEYEELRQEYEELRYTFHNLKLHHDVLEFEVAPKQGHITPKPVDLLEYIIKTSSNAGNLVLDCFMGSGSTGVACINTNRKFIGIEKDEKYFEIACNRIKEVKK